MRRWLNDYSKNVGAVLSIVFIFVIALSFANKQASNRVQQAATVAHAGRPLDVLGETYEAKGYTIAINRIQSYPVDETSADKRIQVEIALTNTSDSTLQLSPGLQMYLQDSKGMAYPVTARYLGEGEAVGGPVGPGATTNVTVDFDLPPSASPASFIYQSDISSEQQVIKL